MKDAAPVTKPTKEAISGNLDYIHVALAYFFLEYVHVLASSRNMNYEPC